MASNIKFKRSSVQNRVPTTAQLELGELALNTYDGKLYTEINTGSAAVVEIGSKLSSLVVDGDNGGGNGDVTFHGATASRDLLWDASADSLIALDNTKISFGDTSTPDLSIYHTGSHSYIKHSGTGNLYTDIGNGDQYSITTAESAHIADFVAGGAVTLRFNGNERIKTTTDGADVSGTGSLKLPVGTTAQRSGSPTAGDMRYNSTTGSFEGYTNGWGELGGAGIGIGSTSVNPGSGVVGNVVGVGYTTINFVGAGLSVTGYGTTIVVDLGNAVSRKYGRSIHSYTATANQTTFTGMSYTDGASQISVYLNGAKLSAATYTATSGNTVVLGTGASVGDEVEIICIDSGVDLTRTVHSFTATAGQTAFTGLGYERGENLDVYLNGIRLAQSDYTATNGTSITLAAGASVGDLLEVVDMGPGAQWESGFGADPDDIYRLNGGVGIGTTNPTDKLNIVGNAEVIGVLTATTFKGDGSALTGIDTDKIEEGNTSVEVIDSGTGQVDIDIDGSQKYRFTDGSLNFASGTVIRMTGIAGGTGGGLHLDGAGNNGRIAVFGNSGTLSLLHSTASSDTNMGVFNKGGSVDLYHNGNKKFETAAYGVNVTGTTDTDGLVVSGVTTTSGAATIGGNLTVTGNLQIDGTTTTVNSTTMTVDDKNIVLGSGAANDAAADGGGITLESGDGNKTWNWVDSTDAWTSSEHIKVVSGKTFIGDGSTLTNVNAATLDSIDSASFLRSDANDTYTGTLSLAGVIKGSDTYPLVQVYSSKAYFGSTSRATQIATNSSTGITANVSGTAHVMWHAGNDGSGSGLDADTLDSIDSGSFLRSDANDTMTGVLTINTSSAYGLTFGGSNDAKILLNGTNPYIRFQEGGTNKGYLQWHSDGYIQLYNQESGEFLKVGSGANGLTYTDGGSEKTVFHSGNLSTFGANQIELTTSTNYPLKITSSSHGKIVLGGSTDPYIRFREGTTDKAYIQWSSAGHLQMVNQESGEYLRVSSGVNGLTYTIDGVSRTVWHAGNLAPMVTDGNNTVDGDILLAAGHHFQRSDHHSGHLEGSYNNVGGNGMKTNPIYTIGSNYNPNDASLNNMYGIGYCYTGASFISSAFTNLSTNTWGLYVAADGDARVFLDAQTGKIHTTGHIYSSNITTTGGATLGGNITVGTGTASYITMIDSDHGSRQIHNNSNYIGFLKADGNWGARCADDGKWDCRAGLNVEGTGTFDDVTVSNRTTSLQVKVAEGNNGFVLSSDGQYMTHSVGHTADHHEGIFWHTGSTYGIYRTAGAWTGSTYQQLRLDWPTGIILDGGSSYTYSGVRFQCHAIPWTNDDYDLGTSGLRWRNIYTNDLNLSNEGGEGNDVDGTTGNYTIQEGEDELYLINNKSGKKYKFNLTEVS